MRPGPLAAALFLSACAVDVSGIAEDHGPPDLGPEDLGVDLGPPDLGPPDLGPLDLGPPPECEEGQRDCVDGDLRACDDGFWIPVQECVYGCAPNGLVCGNLDVTHVDDDDLLFASEVDVEPTASLHFDTDTGAITADDAELRPAGEGDEAGIEFTVQSQPLLGPELGIFSLGSLVLPEDAELTASGSRALVLLVAGDVYVAGTVDVGAHGRDAGPGGGAGGGRRGHGGDPGGGHEGDVHGTFGGQQSGGGGGGHVAAGGRGGDDDGAHGGAGGPVISDPDGEPLVGGGGGGGGGSSSDGGPGGGGGGALQITAGGILYVDGVLRSPGAGGERAKEGGGGGGAGGTLFLEARYIQLEGVLAANGGGGGGGGNGSHDGERGHDDRDLAEGGGGAGDGGPGGADGLLEGFPGQNGEPGGGGGGAIGRVVLRGRSVNDGLITVDGAALTRLPLTLR